MHTKKILKISIAISDTGVGIPEKALSTIFVEFIQANSTIERSIWRIWDGADNFKEASYTYGWTHKR